MRKSKYNNKKTTLVINGITRKFDSKVESERGAYLAMLEMAGEIHGLEYQPTFLLQEGFRRDGRAHRPIKYIADFRYSGKHNTVVVEDIKSKATLTSTYAIKKKLFLKLHGDDIIFQEVYKIKGLWNKKVI